MQFWAHQSLSSVQTQFHILLIIKYAVGIVLEDIINSFYMGCIRFFSVFFYLFIYFLIDSIM